MRKMATIRRIDNIEPIEGADAIMVATGRLEICYQKRRI